MRGLHSRRLKNKSLRGYLKKKRFMAVATLLTGVSIAVMINLNTVIVHADTEQNYVYESIKVMPNDSVWSIAKKYCPKDIDIKEYIDTVEELNGISSDYIVEGNYILIPVYE